MPRLRKNEKLLRPVHPNAGIAAQYRKALLALVDDMNDSVRYWLESAYRNNEPAIMAMDAGLRARCWTVEHDTAFTAKEFDENCAGDLEEPHRGTPRTIVYAMDATPAAELQGTIDDLTKRWKKRFATGSQRLAEYFATKTRRNGDRVLMKILKDAGMTVEFRMTPAMRDVMRATIEQNVGLIRSIPEQHLTKVQGAVMRSVQAGRDLGSLTKELEHEFGVSRRRAALIARNQNNMATASMTRVRQTEAGIDYAIWLHSAGGKEPRPTHVANSGKRYKISEGWKDPATGKYIWPGTEINCRCVTKSIIKGFS